LHPKHRVSGWLWSAEASCGYTWIMSKLTSLLATFTRAAFLLSSLALLPVGSLLAQTQDTALAGSWLFNESLSENTDRKVEAALRASGEKVQRRLFDRTKDRYRGGPADHELYDRISYDRELHISLGEEVYQFSYSDAYTRPVYLDNRSRSVSLTGLDQVEDFSMAHWENGRLLVEGRARDGGFAEETYTLLNNGAQLQVDLYIQPRSFRAPIELRRIYDRAAPR